MKIKYYEVVSNDLINNRLYRYFVRSDTHKVGTNKCSKLFRGSKHQIFILFLSISKQVF